MPTNDIPAARIPVSTYRLQFNGIFTFAEAKRIVPYLSDLGISDIYASPYFRAKEGSLHGYDIVNHNELNPEVGTEEEYDELVRELGRHGMGQVLDIVPNHMCIASRENAWWMDVLENGPCSVYAGFFDIDWTPVKDELRYRVLLPFLGDQYGNVLDNGELQLAFEEGSFFIQYYDHKFPVSPQTYANVLQFRLEELEQLLPGYGPYLAELLSIMTAINHLPHFTERDHEKVTERYREKEIIKKRLLDLYSESAEVKNFIDENVRIFNGVRGDHKSFDLLDKLLTEQIYRLSHWRVATDEINYRRFFDINELAAIRMEEPAVYGEAHRLIFKLVREEKVTGLRVDHPDGLYKPSEYLSCLQRDCFVQKRLKELPEEALRLYWDELLKDPQYKPFYIVGEKILIRGERMPEDWPIFSTTGYVFLNSVNGIFIRTGSAKEFDDIYTRFIKQKINYQDLVYEKKKLIMNVAMASEINTLGHYLNRISEKDRHTRDFTLNSLVNAIVEVIALFPVYRTYINPSGVNDKDRKYIELAVSKAKRTNPAISGSIFDFLRDVLLLNSLDQFDDNDKKERLDFVMRFQQLTGPVMAKGVEDTVFYVYNRFVCLNEVGGSPDRFGTQLETFHGQNIERSKFWPHAMIATSTHDSKRSEDVRARLDVLSELPEKWKGHLNRWSRLNKKKKIVVEGRMAPDRNEEYLLYQTLAGAWPVDPPASPLGKGGIEGEGHYEILKKRTGDYMLKAAREAKINTSWISPHAAYEDALITFIESVMSGMHDNEFLKDFLPFQKVISHYGMFNSLSQTLLKITSPGVPDFYQGTEIWDFSLVDPDNRRPVDYNDRTRMLEEIKKDGSEKTPTEFARELTANKEDGRIKLYLTYKALNFRRDNRMLFDAGEYIPLEVRGEKSEHVCAFARKAGASTALVAVPRFLTGLIQPEGLPFGAEVWADSFLIVPPDEAGSGYRNIFTGESVAVRKQDGTDVLFFSEVFANFPVALLERIIPVYS
ncbi:MAG: malto-oligosyltrehalose synthase [Nitrospiraceae bacterium]|nr:MAG: malto-oligosyltrehalose synthase [Nitrospiraceae bacterium]